MSSGTGPMKYWIKFWIQLIYLTVYVHQTRAGICWTNIDSRGLCRSALNFNLSLADCCTMSGFPTISWTPGGTQDRSPFYWTFLSDGAKQCQRCHTTCDSVTCQADQVCRLKNGNPECICRPTCDPVLKSLGKVCGTDGKKYKNYCSLLRKNCFKKGQKIEVAYFGKCRQSCKRVRCEDGKTCMEDQYGHPHCVRCSKTCNASYHNNPVDYICGEDGRTYQNTCELKAAICRRGMSIRTAYYGGCFANATCNNVRCGDFSRCVLNPATHTPVCIDCINTCFDQLYMPICGTDGHTYSNYCDLKKARCDKNTFIDTKKSGPCKKRLPPRIGNMNDEAAVSYKQKQRFRHRRQKMKRRNRRRLRLQKRLQAKKRRKLKGRELSKSNTIHDTNVSVEHRKREAKE